MACQLPLPEVVAVVVEVPMVPPRPRRLGPLGRQLQLLSGEPRRLPLTRAECPVERPCPYVTCRHHLLVDAVEERFARINRHALRVMVSLGARRLWDLDDDGVEAVLRALPESCSLDLADDGDATQETVAWRMGGWWRTRVEAIEARAKRAALEACRAEVEEDCPEDDDDPAELWWSEGRRY